MPKPYDDKDPSETTTSSGRSAKVTLPTHPGPRANQDLNSQHIRDIEQILAESHLLEVAQGKHPRANRYLQDYDITLIPGDPTSTRYQELFIRFSRENSINKEKRETNLYGAWQSIYLALSEACKKTHPALHEEMYRDCLESMTSRHIYGGYMDGPMAYALYMLSLIHI